MANFYYNAGTWYSDDQYTTAADIFTITSGDAIYGNNIDAMAFYLPEVGNVNLTGVDLSGASFSSSLTNYYGIWIIEGVPTTLPESGTGWDSITNIYYISGAATTLDSNGSGFWSDKAYYYGAEQPTGWNDYFYYIDNVETTLDPDGNGLWNDLMYSGGTLFTGSATPDGSDYQNTYSQTYYINGYPTGLNRHGGGYYNNDLYVNGVVNNSYTGVLNDFGYFIDGQLVPVTSIDKTGNGYYNGDVYVSGLIVPNYAGRLDMWYYSGNGGISSRYFINSQETSLNFSGYGIYNGYKYAAGEIDISFTGDYNGTSIVNGAVVLFGWINGVYYINNVETTLDSSGSGFWDNKAYYQGSEQPTGSNDYFYYINNVETTLDSSGNGVWNDVPYQDGSIFTDGFFGFNGFYYIGGVQTTLDFAGNGFWSDKAYYNGSEQPTGWNDYFYYIDNVETTLDSNGDGEWNGGTYIGGVLQGGGGGGSVNLESGLQAFYKLSDTSDSSGNGNTLTNNGNVSFASGKIGNAAVFDGQSYFTHPDFKLGGFTGLTFSVWIKTTYTEYGGQYGGILGNWDADPDNQSLILIYSEGLNYYVNTENGMINIASTSSLFDGEWKHVVGTYNGSELKLYVSNNLDSTVSHSGTIATNAALFGIGNLNNGNCVPFVGEIDAVGIWNRALSDAEVAALYNSGTGLELGTTPTLNTLTKIQGNAKFYGKVKFSV